MAKPRALDSLASPELNGIIQRLALFEPPSAIARGYKVSVRVVERVAQEYGENIRRLRTSWEKWINRVEPLTNKPNSIVFLGNLCRRAAREGQYQAALKIWEKLHEVYAASQTATATDTLVLDMLERADFEHAKRMAHEQDTIDEERLLPEPSFAAYLHMPEAQAIDAALADMGVPELEEAS